MSGSACEISNTIIHRRIPNDFVMGSKTHQYGIPDNYNPDDHPAVRLRNHNSSDQSETQRKRRSKNRLSNRRSTGYVPQEMVEAALKMGDQNTMRNEKGE